MRYVQDIEVSKEDTYDVTESLGVIILAYLKKLYEFKDEDGFGVPFVYLGKQAEIQGVDPTSKEVDSQAAFNLRVKDLEELIWTFDPNNYPEYIEKPLNYTSGLEEHRKAVKEYYERRQAGYKLFGEVFDTLCW